MPETRAAKVDDQRKVNVTELVKSAVMDADNEVRLHVENVTDLANKDKDDFFSVLSRYQRSDTNRPKSFARPRLASLLDTAGFAVTTNLLDAVPNLIAP